MLVLAFFAAGAAAFAIPATEDVSRRPETHIVPAPERKTMGWFFNRPSQTNAVEQLAYAAQLLKEEKKWKAASEYNALVCAWHESPQAATAQLQYALLLEDAGDYRRAFDEFQYLIRYFSGDFNYDDILQRQFKLANAIRTQKHFTFMIFPGFTSPERALPLFEQIVSNGPTWSHTPEIQINIGLINEDLEDYDAAITAYDAVQNRHPDSPFAAEASFRRAHCYYLLAGKTPRDETACRDALSAIASFIASHRESPNAETAKRYFDEMKEHLADLYYERASFYDYKAHNLKAAIIAYTDFIKKFPASRKTDIAQKRLDELNANKTE
jgi:outer membrane assembly lipoprotein YfiO